MSARKKPWFKNRCEHGQVDFKFRCSLRVPFDSHVADDFWRQYVTNDKWRRDVLCLPCLDEIASKAGGNVLDALELVYFSGLHGTLAFVSAAAIRALLPPKPAQ